MCRIPVTLGGGNVITKGSSPAPAPSAPDFKPDCPSFTDPGSSYVVSGAESGVVHLAAREVRCAANFVAAPGGNRDPSLPREQTLRCLSGSWEALGLSCLLGDCGALPAFAAAVDATVECLLARRQKGNAFHCARSFMWVELLSRFAAGRPDLHSADALFCGFVVHAAKLPVETLQAALRGDSGSAVPPEWTPKS